MKNIKFSKWTKWQDREDLNGIECSGVYLLAHFKKPRTVNPISKKIIYIGETSRRSLRERLKQFDRSAFGGGNNHSGGNTYEEIFGDSKKRYLYVCIGTTKNISEEMRAPFVKYAERKLIWEYVKKNRRLPECNKG